MTDQPGRQRWNKFGRQRAAALLLAWASALPSVAQQRPADPDLPGPTMTLVRKSTERFQGEYLDVTRLPKTISIDPLTPAEILETQRLVYQHVMRYGPDITDSWQRSPNACMQWISLRHQPNEPWQTVAAHNGWPVDILKINGAFWTSWVSYEIPHQTKTSGVILQFSEQVPGAGPGKGQVRAIMLGPFSSPGDATARREEVFQRRGRAPMHRT